MDPLRAMIHLGLKMTETTLDRTLDVVRLVDTVLVASAVPTEHEATSDEPVWPQEEQADLDALSATLRARKEPAATSATPTAAKKAPAKKSTAAKKAPAKTKSAAKKPAARPASAKKASTSTTAAARKTATTKPGAKKAATKKAATKRTSAKKAAPQKPPAKTSTPRPETPSLVVLPDA